MSRDAVEQNLPLMTLTAMVVGGMVGAGVFRSRATLHRRPAFTGHSSPGLSPERAC